MTSKILINFEGSGEAGCGVGVEKEVFEDLSRCLVQERSGDGVSMSCGSPLFTTVGAGTKDGDTSADSLIPVSLSDSAHPTQIEKTCFISFGMLIGHIILRRVAGAGAGAKSHDGLSSVCLPIDISNIFWRIVLRKEVWALSRARRIAY